jgi:hypothetical protein
MSSLNGHTAWEGNIEVVIALSIRDSSRPLADLACDDDEAGPIDVVKDKPADPRGKLPADEDYNFFQYYDRRRWEWKRTHHTHTRCDVARFNRFGVATGPSFHRVVGSSSSREEQIRHPSTGKEKAAILPAKAV